MKLAGFASYSLTKVTSLLVTAGVVAWSATHVAETIWHVLAPDTALSASSVTSGSGFVFMQRSAPAQTLDLDRLQSVFVFSRPGQSSGPSIAAESAVADTRLALTLKGAISSSDPAHSRAIIANADTQEVYRAGDTLRDTPGSVMLQEIHQTYVLLDNNGRIETLRMDDPQPAASSPNPGESSPNQVPVAQNSTDDITFITLPADIDAHSELTDLVRIQPVFEPADSARAGALRGLQIRHGSRQDFLAAVGLRQGDLITAVNGQQLQAAADLPALMAQLSSQQVVSLQLMRDQKPVTVQLDRSRW